MAQLAQRSQNGWPVIGQTQTFKWVLPLKKGVHRYLILRSGDVGFILAHFALWFHETIEPLNVGTWDEWGWAARKVRGSSTDISNHASGTAEDLNATQHTLGKRGTFKKRLDAFKIKRRLKWMNNVIRWGGTYFRRADEMHFEVVGNSFAVAALARRLRKTPRGKRLLEVNPLYK